MNRRSKAADTLAKIWVMVTDVDCEEHCPRKTLQDIYQLCSDYFDWEM